MILTRKITPSQRYRHCEMISVRKLKLRKTLLLAEPTKEVVNCVALSHKTCSFLRVYEQTAFISSCRTLFKDFHSADEIQLMKEKFLTRVRETSSSTSGGCSN